MNSEEDNIKFRLEQFPYATQFDTLQMLKRTLTKNYLPESNYPIKGIDINALFLIGIFPNKPMSFYCYKLNLENGSFNYIANKIQKLGLVEIKQDSEDKRCKVFVLTEKGNAELLYLRTNLNKHIEERLSVLPKEEISLFFESMENIRTIAKKLLSGEVKYE